jgi:gamma-glutamyltranspeptidase/glutathione hydrolase
VAQSTVSSATGSGAVAASPHHLATRAALEIVAGGGNAVDGALAANAVLGTVLPTTCGVGGDLFALVHVPGEDAPSALNASGRAGAGLDPDLLRARGHTTVPLRSRWSITVPGCVDGWVALSERFGTLPLGTTLQPALRHAERGFQTSPELAAALERLQPVIGGRASAPELFPGGRSPATGEIIHRPAYAAVLGAIAAGGRDGLYRGPVGRAISEATGGMITEEDLVAGSAIWTEPIGIEVFGRTAWTVPPNSQGYLAPAACWVFEQLDPAPDPGDPAFHHAAVEAYRAVAAERDDVVADPEHAPIDPARLLDPDRLSPLASRILPGAAARLPPPAPAPGGTAYLCVVDGRGMGVSLIQSNFTGLGSGISAGATGVWLHNRGAGFSLRPGHPNEAGPGKRPLHTLAPTLWTEGARTALLLGTRGGHQQPQYLLQTAALLHHAVLDPAAAQRVPRWHIDGGGSSPESILAVEEDMPETVVSGLASRGHRIEVVPARRPDWGPVSVITVDPDGTRRAAADPRVSTATAAAG